MNGAWHVHIVGEQKVAWALDEDIAWVRRSLNNRCRWTSLPRAQIVHAVWPAAVSAIPADASRGKFVICQADNPPSFYLGTEEFARVADRVDLWVARSREALSQFRLLGLPAELVPYAVDPTVFRPLENRTAIRQSLGIPDGAFVVGNFHRDSEGANLARPKKQKGPDLFLEIVRRLQARVPETVVLLAGPRRHWLLHALRGAGVPVVFAGVEPGAVDDYERNILPRSKLNELYQALDVCLISSRWEGGPYSALEALASGTAAASSPVGAARDVLPPESIYSSVDQAVEILTAQARAGFLSLTCGEAARRLRAENGPDAICQAYLKVYKKLPRGGVPLAGALVSAMSAIYSRVVPAGRSHLKEPGGWLSEMDKSALAAVPELIEYPIDGTREQLFQTAALIKALRFQA